MREDEKLYLEQHRDKISDEDYELIVALSGYVKYSAEQIEAVEVEPTNKQG